MSDDLTRRIEAIVWQIIAGMDEPEAAIASLIAEEREKARLAGYAECGGHTVALIDAARASARREALEEAAAYIDCGCECRPMVMMALTTSERAAQRVCTSNNTCVAIEAAAIRSLAKEATNGQ